jgi:hypothetical protein
VSDAAAAAWREFCEQLARTGDRLLGPDFPTDPNARAEGYRHLSRLTVMALQSHLEFADTDFPAFHRYDDDAVKWGGPNVDNQYLRARIDPGGVYRVVGNVAGVRDLIVSTHEGDMQLGQYGVYAERRLAEFAVGDDDRVEFVLGGPATSANWLPLDPRTRIVMIRTYLHDWNRDESPWFDIERLDRDTPMPVPFDCETLARGLAATSDWIDRSVVYWRDYLEQSPVRALVNRLSAPRGASGGSDRILYGAGWWHLDDRTALAIEFPAPRAEYWSIQLYSTPWFESLDVRNRLNSYNAASAITDADGRVRLAVSSDDPGIANWLDTEGRSVGMVSYRFIGAVDPPTPSAQVVPIGDLWPELPRLDATARARQIEQRRHGIARRFHR